ncbi:hypothetical protein Dimus_024772, partial [Dionaea muscipula]
WVRGRRRQLLLYCLWSAAAGQSVLFCHGRRGQGCSSGMLESMASASMMARRRLDGVGNLDGCGGGSGVLVVAWSTTALGNHGRRVREMNIGIRVFVCLIAVPMWHNLFPPFRDDPMASM